VEILRPLGMFEDHVLIEISNISRVWNHANIS
jgi:hypothetical protein